MKQKQTKKDITLKTITFTRTCLSDRFYTCPRGKWFMFMSKCLSTHSLSANPPSSPLLFNRRSVIFRVITSGLFSPLMVTNSGLDCLADKIGTLICVVKLPLRRRPLFRRGAGNVTLEAPAVLAQVALSLLL